jgi:hypothetical protein
MAWYSFLADTLDSVAGTATGILDSDGVQSAIKSGSDYAIANMNAKALKAQKEADAELRKSQPLPSWVLPVGIGSALLLVAALILSRRGR